MATRASASKVNSTPYCTLGFPPSSTGVSESSLYLQSGGLTAQRRSHLPQNYSAAVKVFFLFLPDQTQRVFPNVDETPQSLDGLVGGRRHVRKLQQSDQELKLLALFNQDGVKSGVFTCTGRFPRKLRSIFSPKRYPSGCGVSNFSPPMKKWLAK